MSTNAPPDPWPSICGVLLAASLVLGAELALAGDDAKPNIIVIFTDDHGWSDLGCHGVQPDILTPHLDALAAGGVRMSSGYVTAPQCVPSRAGLLTGKYQPRFGVESNGSELGGFDAQQTVAERLKQAGYSTGMTGKWHLGPAQEIPGHGFDDVYCTQGRVWANFDLDGNSTAGGFVDNSPYHLDANTAAAVAFIRRHRDKPFFFYLAYRAPHVPLDAPRKYLQRFRGKMAERRRQALAMLSAVDDGVGAVMRTLREHSIEERTLLFFISDNGAPLKIHKQDAPGGGPGWDGSLNDPLNGEKGMLTEGGIRVPFLVYWKGNIKGGQVFDHPVISLDVAATAASLAGLPDDPEFDGVNLVPFLNGEKTGAPHETLYWRWIAQSAVRVGKWKFLRAGRREYLFDLNADPGEHHNCIAEQAATAKRLRAGLESWAAGLRPPGIQIQPMAQTWENYYDFYLDGQAAPASNADMNAPGSAGGWIARNGTAELKNGALRVTPDGKRRQKPFVAFPRLKVSGPATAAAQIRSTQGGRLGFAWRLEGQKDFPPDQTVVLDVPALDDWRQIETELPTDGVIIHLRVLLPAGPTEIRRIKLSSNKTEQAKKWFFESE